MIKSVLKYMFSLLIICLGIVNISFCGYSRQIGVYGFQPYDQSVNINVITKGTLNTELIGEVKKIFWFDNGNYFKWDYSSDLGGVSMYAVNQIFGSNGYYLNQGFINDYLICNKTITGVSLDWSISSNYYTGCTKYTISNGNLQTIKNFVDSIKSTDYYGFDFDSSTACIQAVLCFSSEQYGKSLCFGNSIKGTSSIYNNCYPYFFLDYGVYNGGNTIYSKSYGTGWGSANSDYSSPAVSWSDDLTGSTQVSGDIIHNEVTSNDLISYFENSPLYGFDSQICYVGTNDLSSPYESGLAYYPGTGKTIFDLYERLYGTGEYTINKMGTFLNTWWINYFTFWENDNRDENGNPLYVAKFDGNNFWLDYQDLTSPFINNLAAIYFMASKITMYGQQSTIGEEIATYCYYKLGEIENVIDDSNQSYWNNAGNYEKQRQKNIGEYQDPSGEGTGGFRSKLGIYDNTGDKTDFASNFKNFYAKMSGKFDSVSDFNGFGVIPDYILGFLVLIVLFRILRGKGRN